MADSFTTHYNFTKPSVGGDPNTWGGLLNIDLDQIDAAIWGVSETASGALPLTGGTLTGELLVNLPAVGVAVAVTNTNAGGAILRLIGDGAITPSKHIRATGGVFQVLNDANTLPLFTLTDIGAATIPGAFGAAGVTTTGDVVVGGGLYVNSGVETTTVGGASATWGINPLGISGTFGAASTSTTPFVVGVGGAETARFSVNGAMSLNGVSDTNGAQIFLNGNGATTPTKQIRARAGSLEIVNSANSAIISALTDGGVWSAADFQATSDPRLKRNRRPLAAGYEELKRCTPYEYEKKGPDGVFRAEVGFLSTEVAEVLATAVSRGEDGFDRVSHPQLLALVVAAVLDIGRALELQGIL